jgi:hypothetical protein
MAAHGGVAFIVHEEHGKVRAGKVRFDQKRAIHVMMAARLVHQHFAQMVEIIADIGALFENGARRQRRIAGGDDPQRLAACVHVGDSQLFHKQSVQKSAIGVKAKG